MKYPFQIIILFFILTSCNQNTTSTKGVKLKSQTLDKEAVVFNSQSKNIRKVYLKEKQYDLSMYNNKYSLKIKPDSSSSQEDMMYQILLTMKSDTIINQFIDMDTISLKSKKTELKKNYYLSEIYNGYARARYLHLLANLNSKKDTTNINITIQFEYIGSEIGKLSIY